MIVQWSAIINIALLTALRSHYPVIRAQKRRTVHPTNIYKRTKGKRTIAWMQPFQQKQKTRCV